MLIKREEAHEVTSNYELYFLAIFCPGTALVSPTVGKSRWHRSVTITITGERTCAELCYVYEKLTEITHIAFFNYYNL